VSVEAEASSAWLFPGQGAQKVGMGRDLYEAYPAARSVFDRADAALNRPLSRIIFEGPEEELRQTVNTQPAILVMSLATLEAGREITPQLQRVPAFVAGHSLGEYTALVAAGALTLDDGIRLVQERGRLMQEEGQSNPGTMAALLGARGGRGRGRLPRDWSRDLQHQRGESDRHRRDAVLRGARDGPRQGSGGPAGDPVTRQRRFPLVPDGPSRQGDDPSF
jgi:malonyl CoA-acyl carrier protein transacylase